MTWSYCNMIFFLGDFYPLNFVIMWGIYEGVKLIPTLRQSNIERNVFSSLKDRLC